jgi:hypothetical protein
MSGKTNIKKALGVLPFAAELYWLLRNPGKKAFSRFNLDDLKTHLPKMIADTTPYAQSAPTGKKVFLFVYLHFWIKHATAIGLTLRGLGHEVTLGFLPYGDFAKPIDRFDAQRQNVYARDILKKAQNFITPISFFDLEPMKDLPEALVRAVERVTVFDTQYILQREEVTGKEPVFKFRHERNMDAARKAMAYFQKKRPDVVVIANGMIQEFGAVYETARYLNIPTVTYEFGEQDQRIWLGQNNLVINHITDNLWISCEDRILSDEQRAWLDAFLTGRQEFSKGTQFAHLWQKTGRDGGDRTRYALGLDVRPVVLLPTNVLGDSATLGLTHFTHTMAEWVERTVLFFANRPEVQLVVRIHPGETLTVGPSVADVIHKVLPDLPSHIRLIDPKEKINTYDLMDIADLALVYTTTAGMEMAVRAIPVVVGGKAHYRGKGFTLDPETWDEYFAILNNVLKDPLPYRLTKEQVERALNYCYFYFREYARPFPWHLEKLWSSLEERPISYVLSPEGRTEFEPTFREMTGESIKQTI